MKIIYMDGTKLLKFCSSTETTTGCWQRLKSRELTVNATVQVLVYALHPRFSNEYTLYHILELMCHVDLDKELGRK